MRFWNAPPGQFLFLPTVMSGHTAMDLAAMETEAKGKARKQVANLLQVTFIKQKLGWILGPHLNIKTVFPGMEISIIKLRTVLWPSYLYNGNPYYW